jgi:hypothetical protein
LPIIAGRIPRNRDASINIIVTGIEGAVDLIVTRICPWMAFPRRHVARLFSIAIRPVLTIHILETRDTPRPGFITEGIETPRYAALTIVHRVAGFVAVAVYPVIANGVLCGVNANGRFPALCAVVLCAGDTVIAARSGTRLTTVYRVAKFRTVAIESVVADAVVGSVHTLIHVVVAAIDGAFDVVFTRRGRTVLTARVRIAGLLAVAEESVIADTVLSRVHADGFPVPFGTLIQRTFDIVITVRQRPIYASLFKTAGLCAIAVDTVVAAAVRCNMRTKGFLFTL